MDDQAVVRAWKEPEARQENPVNHPAGEIRLGSASTLSQRIGLLSGLAATGLALVQGFGDPATITTTMSPNTVAITL